MSAVFEYTKTCMLCVKKDNFVRASQIEKVFRPPPFFLEIFGLFVFSDVFTSVIVFGILWRSINISTWFSLFLVPLPNFQNLFKKTWEEPVVVISTDLKAHSLFARIKDSCFRGSLNYKTKIFCHVRFFVCLLTKSYHYFILKTR